jgi:hypothetical protein
VFVAEIATVIAIDAGGWTEEWIVELDEEN